MIRHLTTLKAYDSILIDKVIKPRVISGRDNGVISFEYFKENDVFV